MAPISKTCGTHKLHSLWVSFLCCALLISIAGCVTFRLCGTTFRVEGQVFDEETKQPLEAVIISFTDSGLSWTKDRASLAMGTSDTSGKFAFDFRYKWCKKGYPFVSDREESFEVSLAKPGYWTKTITFKRPDLTSEDGLTLVPVSNVFLRSSDDRRPDDSQPSGYTSIPRVRPVQNK